MNRLCLGTLLVAIAGIAGAAPAEVPEAIKAPAGETVLLRAHAIGYQVYTCTVAADQSASWVLKAPDAQLRDRKHVVVGKHFAGPTWQYKDGSSVSGKATAHAESPDKSSIPWLLVSATGHSGEGLLATVTSIQRINTRGGRAPADSECTRAKAGAESRVKYTADYVFYAPKK